MKSVTAFFFAIVLIASWSNLAHAQAKWEYPVIKGYGPVHPLPDAAIQPDKSLNYKILFDITQAAKEKGKVNPALDHLARLINVFASAGMMPDKMKLVAIIHGPATPVVLNNEEFKSKFGIDNPDIKLINDLKKSGVVFYVCGQALADNSYEHKWVNKGITIALSALTVVPTYQLRGYALMAW
ncbi:MAG: DsrE family protein [Bacteroidetes bacterium]|nr:DsrE family protein [Bacteroidota bacterium]